MNTKHLFLIAGAVAIAAMTSSISPDLTAQEPEKEVEVPTYIGSMACRKCHGDQHKTWKKTNMANAFDLLKPGVRPDKKTAAGLDPEKDYTKDETCLPCHVTGWGEVGGYAIPPEGDSPEAVKAQKAAKAMEGIQCESCHGPASMSSAYKKAHEEYKIADLEAAVSLQGVIYPDANTCKKCHNTDSPFVTDEKYVFDFKTRKDEGTHTHYRMDFEHDCDHEHNVTKKKKKKKK